MDNLSIFIDLSERIKDIEMKLDAVILRLEICERQLGRRSLDLNLSASINPLDQYVSGLTTESCAPSPVHKQHLEDNLLSSQRWHSQPEQRLSYKFQKVDTKQNVLDSKSFAMIKRSILINSEEITHMKEKLIEVEQQYTRRIISVEEGFELVARLSQMMESRLQQLAKEPRQSKEDRGGPKKKKPADRRRDLIQKYQRSTWPRDMDLPI